MSGRDVQNDNSGVTPAVNVPAVTRNLAGQQPGMQTKPDDNNGQAQDLTLKGRFARYDSAFLKLMIPLLTTRYLWVGIEEINPFNILNKPPSGKLYTKPTFGRYLSRNFKALGMGATVLSIMAFYSKRTYDDIRTLYSEAVGYELGKKPSEVTVHDIFSSKNSAVMVTRNDFVKRSLARFGSGMSFFIPWHKLRPHKQFEPKWDGNLNAGVGAVGTYLSMDGFSRHQTFFEAQQEMVDIGINHVDTNTTNIINPAKIRSLLMLHRKRLNPGYEGPMLDSRDAANEEILASRIADLMNQTYNNITNTEHAHFTLGKFNYLVGFGMLDSHPESLAFVELANRSPDMKEVKKALTAIQEGENPQAVFQAFGIDLQNPVGKNASSAVNMQSPTGKFMASIPSAKDKMPLLQRTHQDFAENVSGPQLMNP